jgi:hypothetical protein
MSTVQRLALLAATMVGVVLGFAPAAHAQSSDDRGTQLLKEIIASKDRGAMAHLSPADQSLVKQSFQENLIVTIDASKSSAGTVTNQSDPSIAAAGCWYDYEYSTATLFGISVGHFWMQLNWCGNGGSITSYNVNPIGDAGMNGFTATYSGPSFRNVGWEVRAVGVFTFSTFQGLGSSICGQIRGGASGMYSAFIGCKM